MHHFSWVFLFGVKNGNKRMSEINNLYFKYYATLSCTAGPPQSLHRGSKGSKGSKGSLKNGKFSYFDFRELCPLTRKLIKVFFFNCTCLLIFGKEYCLFEYLWIKWHCCSAEIQDKNYLKGRKQVCFPPLVYSLYHVNGPQWEFAGVTSLKHSNMLHSLACCILAM